MRRLTLAIVPALALGMAACNRPLPVIETVEEANRPAASIIEASDPAATPQFMSGFHSIEQKAYRWTKRKFSVALQPPENAARDGAVLELILHVPQPVIEWRKSITLSASVEGTPLAPETYFKAAEYTYSREVPPAALAFAPAKIDFTLDRFLTAGEIESRELGVVVTSVALRPKRAGTGTPQK